MYGRGWGAIVKQNFGNANVGMLRYPSHCRDLAGGSVGNRGMERLTQPRTAFSLGYLETQRFHVELGQRIPARLHMSRSISRQAWLLQINDSRMAVRTLL